MTLRDGEHGVPELVALRVAGVHEILRVQFPGSTRSTRSPSRSSANSGERSTRLKPGALWAGEWINSRCDAQIRSHYRTRFGLRLAVPKRVRTVRVTILPNRLEPLQR